MRVVLDVNVLVSLAIGGRALAPLDEAWATERFGLVVSAPLTKELAEVLARPYLRRYLPAGSPDLLLQRIDLLGSLVELRKPYPEFSDPDDAYLLAMLRDGEADVLVTGDKALQALAEFRGKPILSPAAFLDRLRR